MSGTFFSVRIRVITDWAKIKWNLWITVMNKTIRNHISRTLLISFLLILMYIPKRHVRVMQNSWALFKLYAFGLVFCYLLHLEYVMRRRCTALSPASCHLTAYSQGYSCHCYEVIEATCHAEAACFYFWSSPTPWGKRHPFLSGARLPWKLCCCYLGFALFEQQVPSGHLWSP